MKTPFRDEFFTAYKISIMGIIIGLLVFNVLKDCVFLPCVYAVIPSTWSVSLGKVTIPMGELVANAILITVLFVITYVVFLVIERVNKKSVTTANHSIVKTRLARKSVTRPSSEGIALEDSLHVAHDSGDGHSGHSTGDEADYHHTAHEASPAHTAHVAVKPSVKALLNMEADGRNPSNTSDAQDAVQHHHAKSALKLNSASKLKLSHTQHPFTSPNTATTHHAATPHAASASSHAASSHAIHASNIAHMLHHFG